MIQSFSDIITYSWLGLDGTALGHSLNYFLADTIKILLLLLVINYLMAIIRYYLPIEKIRDYLSSRKFYGLDHLLASLFGCITPFCTCSSIPLFVGFLGARIPLGVTLSFLITSPLVNEAAVAVFFVVFGWKITLIYVLAGIVIGVVGGMILGKLKLESFVEDFVWKNYADRQQIKQDHKQSRWALAILFYRQSIDITKKIVWYVVAGVALGSIIHGYVPQGYFERYITESNIFAVPLAVLIGVPLYSNATGVIPLVQSLVDKGIPLGTALAFMMATVGLSLPEALILKRVMKPKLLFLFFAITALGMMIIGYLFNYIL